MIYLYTAITWSNEIDVYLTGINILRYGVSSRNMSIRKVWVRGDFDYTYDYEEPKGIPPNKRIKQKMSDYEYIDVHITKQLLNDLSLFI